jgi:CheY-like chemotaxis protein
MDVKMSKNQYMAVFELSPIPQVIIWCEAGESSARVVKAKSNTAASNYFKPDQINDETLLLKRFYFNGYELNRLLYLAFKKNNFANEIRVVEDGQEAFDFLLGNDPEGVTKLGFPVLILLDLKLPKMNGYEVLKQIKSNPEIKHIPVIMLTTSSSEADVISSYKKSRQLLYNQTG